ncbi:prefoldin subunit 1 [Larus michahellis]
MGSPLVSPSAPAASHRSQDRPDGEASSPACQPGVPAPAKDATAQPGVPVPQRGPHGPPCRPRPAEAAPRVRSRTPCQHLPPAQAPCGDKMAAPVDLELKKAFTELQAKVIDTQQKVKLADIQIEQLSKTKKHAHLTDTEVMMLVDETRMYEGVGRMFILQSKGVIHNQLLEKQRIAEEKIKELEQKKSYLERSVKEAEDNIREMLMARRAQ